MTAGSIFVATDGRLRAVWRLLLFLALLVVCTVAVFVALGFALQYVEGLSGIPGTSETLGLTIALLLAHGIALRTFDRQPASYVGLDRAAAKPRVLLFGFVLGAVPIGAASLVLIATGQLDVTQAPPGSWWAAAARISILLIPAAFYEELFLRGYVFATLGAWLGPVATVALTSVAFGLLHVPNPGGGGSNGLPIVMVTLAGVYLAVVLLVTRSLYAAWMAHLAWNWVMAVVLHVAVSGLPLPQPGYQLADDGPDWLTGGPWGPEGGVVAGAGMFAGLAYLYWRHSRRSHEQLDR
ncbi:MAG: CPBP family intramembrane glutamic endopeptidase [Gemmatimonadaceae bacterium]